MTTDLLSTTGDEGSGFVVTVSGWTDHKGDTVDPSNITAMSWTLSDANGNIINSRESISLDPAASVEIGLVAAETTAKSGDDVSEGYFERLVLIKWTYNTTINGQAVSNYPGAKEARVRINSFKNVS